MKTPSLVLKVQIRVSGSVRTFKKKIRQEILSIIQRLSEGTCKAYGANCELNYNFGYPAIINSRKEAEISAKLVIDILGEDKIIYEPKPCMTGEDFSYVFENSPGFYN